jgi:hypothetical protein
VKEIKTLGCECDHKAIDILLLLIIFANGAPLRKSAEKVIQKKVNGGFFGKKFTSSMDRRPKRVTAGTFPRSAFN